MQAVAKDQLISNQRVIGLISKKATHIRSEF